MADLELTFDDGPLPARPLAAILEELGRRRRVAAFFVIGRTVAASPAAAREIRDRGHVLGNHSWDHLAPATGHFGDEEVVAQFRRTHDEVLQAADVAMEHWRAPRLEQVDRLARLLTGGESPLYRRPHADVHGDSKDWVPGSDAGTMLEAIRAGIARSPARRALRLLFHVGPVAAGALAEVLDALERDGHRLVDFDPEG